MDEYCCKLAEEDNSVYYDETYGGYVLEVETEWSDYLDWFNTVKININYCPFCGKKLKEDLNG